MKDKNNQEISKEEYKELEEKLKKIKDLVKKFEKKALSKFKDDLLSIALLPKVKEEKEEKIHLLCLIDDKQGELKEEKLAAITKGLIECANQVDKRLWINPLVLIELWQACYDGKYEVLDKVVNSAPVYDKGMLQAIKVAEIHKRMCLEKFEKYITSYVLAGSLVQGKATKDSDIDVFVVIDDTDVKRMTRAELKDRLRAMIIGMGSEASAMLNVKHKLNVQVYILTDFWESIKDVNPIIFTFLRDGVPFYDRGVFMPWKLLLKMGRIKPSPEAIDMYRDIGEKSIERIKFKIKEIGSEDLFYAVLYPSQAALMLYGVAPPTPKETPELLKEIFVKKEKFLEQEYVDIIKEIVDFRKNLEHEKIKEFTGKQFDVLLNKAEKYLRRIKKLFNQIQKEKEKEGVLVSYEHVISITRDALRMLDVKKVKDEEIVKKFKSEIIDKGYVSEKLLRILKSTLKAKEDYNKGKLTKHEINKANKDGREFVRNMIEFIQRYQGKEIERAKIKVKHGNRFGEILLLDDVAFIIHDINKEEKEVSKAEITKEGNMKNIKPSSLEELESALINKKVPEKGFIKEKIFEDLKKLFGKDVEIMLS